jgi:hypothetical protein
VESAPGSITAPRGAAPVALPLAAALSAFALGWLGPLAYPLRLLTTIVHELGHGLAALLTGGAFLRFVVFPDGSGLAYTSGGIPWLIIPAGYVGAALVGAALIGVGRSVRASRLALGAIGALLALLTLRYALPTLLSAQFLGGLLTLAAGVGLGALLLLAAWRAEARWSLFLLNLVAFWVGLSALGDLGALVTVATSQGVTASDAHAMARLTFLPPVFWAAAWALLSAVALGAALWRTWLRPRRAP